MPFDIGASFDSSDQRIALPLWSEIANVRTLKSIAPFASLTWFLIQTMRNKDLVEGLHVDWESIYIAGAVVSALFIMALYARTARDAMLARVPRYKFKGMHGRIERCRGRVEFNY